MLLGDASAEEPEEVDDNGLLVGLAGLGGGADILFFSGNASGLIN